MGVIDRYMYVTFPRIVYDTDVSVLCHSRWHVHMICYAICDMPRHDHLILIWYVYDIIEGCAPPRWAQRHDTVTDARSRGACVTFFIYLFRYFCLHFFFFKNVAALFLCGIEVSCHDSKRISNSTFSCLFQVDQNW